MLRAWSCNKFHMHRLLPLHGALVNLKDLPEQSSLEDQDPVWLSSLTIIFLGADSAPLGMVQMFTSPIGAAGSIVLQVGRMAPGLQRVHSPCHLLWKGAICTWPCSVTRWGGWWCCSISYIFCLLGEASAVVFTNYTQSVHSLSTKTGIVLSFQKVSSEWKGLLECSRPHHAGQGLIQAQR